MATFDSNKPGRYCGYEYDQFLTSNVSAGPRGNYYHLVLIKNGKIIAFGDEQGNYAGGIYASTEFAQTRFMAEKENLRAEFPELYDKIKDIPLAKPYKPANKAIYQPKGKAGEYAGWACNFYTGCSNDCQYCYCKKGVMSHVWSTTPTLKKCFKDQDDALAVFKKEFDYYTNEPDFRKRGLFFSFTTDPLLDETIGLTINAVEYALRHSIPVQVLTKRADGAMRLIDTLSSRLGGINPYIHRIAVGFTLTGHDELEPNADLTDSRIHAMRQIHALGLKTFASIEPMLDLPTAEDVINCTLGFCDLYKIGLLSGGKRTIDSYDLAYFVPRITEKIGNAGAKVYWKESISEETGGITVGWSGTIRTDMVTQVTADYDIFSDTSQIGGKYRFSL